MVAVIAVVSVLSGVVVAVGLGISGLHVLRENGLTEVARQDRAGDGVVASKHLCVINRTAVNYLLLGGRQGTPKFSCLRVCNFPFRIAFS